MRVLSIDPGITTGISIYNDDGELECSLTVTAKGLQRSGFFNQIVSFAKQDITLIEALPTNHVTPEMLAIHSYIKQWFVIASYPIEEIKPAQWKGLAARVEIPGQHARDAATMAKWWLHRENNKKLMAELKERQHG